MQNLCGASHEEITNILSKIQEICNSNNCHDCPFNNKHEECIFNMYSPSGWEIIEEDPKIWKAVY